MRYPFVVIILGIISILFMACSRPVTVSFYVEGACEACKDVIEEELTAMDGVVAADWDFETSLVTMAYRPEEVSEENIQAYIAEKGFATQYYPPNKTARNNLPECCQKPISRKLKREELEIPHH